MPNPSVSVNTNTMSIQKKTDESLDFVVDFVVSKVGVNINTASPSLLAHIAGLNKPSLKILCNTGKKKR